MEICWTAIRSSLRPRGKTAGFHLSVFYLSSAFCPGPPLLSSPPSFHHKKVDVLALKHCTRGPAKHSHALFLRVRTFSPLSFFSPHHSRNRHSGQFLQDAELSKTKDKLSIQHQKTRSFASGDKICLHIMFAFDLDPVKTNFKLERSAVAVRGGRGSVIFFGGGGVCSSAAVFTSHKNQIIVFLKAVFQPRPKMFLSAAPYCSLSFSFFFFLLLKSPVDRDTQSCLIHCSDVKVILAVLWALLSMPRSPGSPFWVVPLDLRPKCPHKGPTLGDFTFSRDSQNIISKFGTKAWRKSSTQTGFWGCCSGCINYCIPWRMGALLGGSGGDGEKGDGAAVDIPGRFALPWHDCRCLFFLYLTFTFTHARAQGKEAKSKQCVMNVDPLMWS